MSPLTAARDFYAVIVDEAEGLNQLSPFRVSTKTIRLLALVFYEGESTWLTKTGYK